MAAGHGRAPRAGRGRVEGLRRLHAHVPQGELGCRSFSHEALGLSLRARSSLYLLEASNTGGPVQVHSCRDPCVPMCAGDQLLRRQRHRGRPGAAGRWAWLCAQVPQGWQHLHDAVRSPVELHCMAMLLWCSHASASLLLWCRSPCCFCVQSLQPASTSTRL